MALSRVCSSPLSSWLLLSLLSVGCLLLQLQEGHALESCQGVQQHLARQGLLRDEVVPDQPIPGDHLKMCVGTTTCCTEMMESKLSIGSTLEFDNNMKKNLNPLANLLDKKKRKFDEFFHNLLNYSRTSFDTTFVKTYGILYKQNKHVFTDLYDNLEDYYNKGQLDLQEAMNGFFKKLYQILFAVYNSQYQFTPKYLRCITRHMEEVQPFGNVSVKLTTQIKRSFMALRTFVQGLATGRDVVRSVLKINPSLPPCVHELMKMSKCAMCAGELGVHPCKPYCLDVVDNCLVHHKPLVQHWHAYVDAMVQVGERLENPFNIENVVEPINYKVSDAIMNFQEAGHEISNKIFHECGQPQLGGWMRNKRQVSAGEPEISFESLDFSGSRQDSRDQNTDTIGHLVHEIKTKIQNSRNFWDELPIKMCSEARRQDDSNCWTGTAVGMYEAKDGQSLNNSSANNSQMNGQIMRLTVITEKLKEAYFGRDVSWINEATMEAGTTDNGSCPIGFEEISNSQKTKKKKKRKSCCYYFTSDFGLKDTWSGAQTYCQELGNQLGVTVNLAEVGTGKTCCSDDKLMAAVASREDSRTWFGATDSESEGRWVWQQSGEVFPLRSPMWWHLEPDNGDNSSNCLISHNSWNQETYRRPYFGDDDCNGLNHFVCQLF